MGERDVIWHQTAAPADFGRSFVQSEAFQALFQEGMDLIEDTAAYLDGPGRDESRSLPREGTRAYAAESMRLTSRLMQIASWLLVHRASAEGEVGSEQVRQESKRVRLGVQGPTTSEAEFDRLPQGLRDLIGLSARLHARILHLDLLIAEPVPLPQPRPAEHPVAVQQELIARAFGRRSRVPA